MEVGDGKNRKKQRIAKEVKEIGGRKRWSPPKKRYRRGMHVGSEERRERIGRERA